MEYFSAVKKTTFETVLVRWMSLEPVKQSDESQKEKKKLYINAYIYSIKMVLMTLKVIYIYFRLSLH